MQLPRVNQKVDFVVLQGPHAAAYPTYVESMDDRAIAVAWPFLGGQQLPLRAGETVKLEWGVESGIRLSFTTRVLGAAMRGVPLVLVVPPAKGSIQSSQHRAFVRLQVVLDLKYSVLPEPGQITGPSGFYYSQTRDISGNGVQILCESRFLPGTQLDLRLVIEGQTIQAVGLVMRQSELPGTDDYATGVRFIRIEEQDREFIMRYIFNETRERRRKGLL